MFSSGSSQIYGFDENGVMRFGFSKVSEDSEDESEVAGYKYYNDYDNGSMVKSDWFYVEPDENIHSDAENHLQELYFEHFSS